MFSKCDKFYNFGSKQKKDEPKIENRIIYFRKNDSAYSLKTKIHHLNCFVVPVIGQSRYFSGKNF